MRRHNDSQVGNDEMTKNQAANDQIKDLIMETLKKQKPETAKQLILLVQQATGSSEEEITKLLIQLENENKICFKKEKPTPSSLEAYVFSSNATWYWITMALAAATSVIVLAVPADVYPVNYFRVFLGALFVLFLPGYAFMKALFPSSVPLETGSRELDMIERAALSLGISLAFTPLVGLILNYTPWGIRLTPITLSLLALSVIFGTAGMLREYQGRARIEAPRQAPRLSSPPKDTKR